MTFRLFAIALATLFSTGASADLFCVTYTNGKISETALLEIPCAGDQCETQFASDGFLGILPGLKTAASSSVVARRVSPWKVSDAALSDPSNCAVTPRKDRRLLKTDNNFVTPDALPSSAVREEFWLHNKQENLSHGQQPYRNTYFSHALDDEVYCGWRKDVPTFYNAVYELSLYGRGVAIHAAVPSDGNLNGRIIAAWVVRYVKKSAIPKDRQLLCEYGQWHSGPEKRVNGAVNRDRYPPMQCVRPDGTGYYCGY